MNPRLKMSTYTLKENLDASRPAVHILASVDVDSQDVRINVNYSVTVRSENEPKLELLQYCQPKQIQAATVNALLVCRIYSFYLMLHMVH